VSEGTLQKYGEARVAFRARELAVAEALLTSVVEEAPLFVPALQLLAATLQLRAQTEAEPEELLARAKALIDRAVVASQRSPSTLNDLGHFLNAAEGQPAAALPVFAEGLRNVLSDALECLDGLISCADRIGGTRVREETVRLNRLFAEFQTRIEILSQLTE
jgi:hypothetical protein